MDKIKILVLITLMDRAGAETVMMNYLRKLNRDKFCVDFLINRPDRADYEDEIEALGGKVYRMSPLYPWKMRTYVKQLTRFLMEHPEYKIIHSNLEERSYVPFKIAKRQGVPVRIAHAHSVPKKRDLKMLVRMYYRNHIKGVATHYFSCGEGPAKWLYGSKENVEIMKNAIEIDKFKQNIQVREEVRKEIGVELDTLLLGHVGRFSYEKNHEFIIDTFKNVNNAHPNSKLLLIGGGKPKSEVAKKAKIIKKVKKLGLEDKVIFLGIREDINRLMQAMDILIMPSITEGFPVTLMESQATGLRSVVSTAVPKECNVTGTIKYLPLKKGPKEWAKEILEIKDTQLDAEMMNRVMKESGYDINDNVEWLENHFEEYERNASKVKRGSLGMKIIKLWYHIKAAFQKFLYKVMFGKDIYFGKGTTWRANFHIAMEQGQIVIGDNCFFNNGCSISALELVVIGDGTIFGENCHVYDHNHRFRSNEDSIKSQGYSIAPTRIGKNCWLGTNVTVLKGVTIGDNCVIGAGCVVEQDVPAGSIVKKVGNLTVIEKE